ncbi:MAG: hypothetical protein Tsb0013_21880 [Phycisphaerales bacterium]
MQARRGRNLQCVLGDPLAQHPLAPRNVDHLSVVRVFIQTGVQEHLRTDRQRTDRTKGKGIRRAEPSHGPSGNLLVGS